VTGITQNSIIYYEGYATNSGGLTGYSSPSNFVIGTLPVTGSVSSAIFDTGYPNGVSFNSIMWQGTLGTGTGAGSSFVQFQFAASSCPNGSPNSNCVGGTWNFIGPDGTSGTYYLTAGPNIPTPLVGKNYYTNQQFSRYYRYEVFLNTTGNYTTPTVTNVIVNWSP
jgi:hypothetical protein